MQYLDYDRSSLPLHLYLANGEMEQENGASSGEINQTRVGEHEARVGVVLEDWKTDKGRQGQTAVGLLSTTAAISDVLALFLLYGQGRCRRASPEHPGSDLHFIPCHSMLLDATKYWYHKASHSIHSTLTFGEYIVLIPVVPPSLCFETIAIPSYQQRVWLTTSMPVPSPYTLASDSYYCSLSHSSAS